MQVERLDRAGGELLQPPAFAGVRLDAGRLAEQLGRLARIGADPGGGITRLAFTPEEREAHQLVSGWMRELSLEVRVDTFGNSYGSRPGKNPDLPALAFGSHLDTVPNGGAYDGAVGTIAALEVMRALRESGRETEHPLLMVIFAAEEGARFGKPNLGSRAVIGELARRDLGALRDARGTTLAEAMRAVALDPDQFRAARWELDQIAAFLELHIEQGQVLESERTTIGLVETIAGSTRLRFEIKGRAVHSGATPMHLRRDALAAAADLTLGIESIASDYRHRTTVATVGKMEIWPNSITTIAGHVTLYVDARDIDSDRQRETANRILELGKHLEEKRGVEVTADILSDSSPSILPTWVRRITGRVCDELGFSYRVMPSGAGHDASIVSALVPAAMIFVPSQAGISHAPEEWSSPEDIAAGTAALCRSVLALDEFLAATGQLGQQAPAAMPARAPEPPESNPHLG
jgi:allantoate deiminase